MNAMERLNKIANANLSGIIDAYQGESRDWWDDVDETRIEADMNDPQFEAFVRFIEATASEDGLMRAA